MSYSNPGTQPAASSTGAPPAAQAGYNAVAANQGAVKPRNAAVDAITDHAAHLRSEIGHMGFWMLTLPGKVPDWAFDGKRGAQIFMGIAVGMCVGYSVEGYYSAGKTLFALSRSGAATLENLQKIDTSPWMFMPLTGNANNLPHILATDPLNLAVCAALCFSVMASVAPLFRGAGSLADAKKRVRETQSEMQMDAPPAQSHEVHKKAVKAYNRAETASDQARGGIILGVIIFDALVSSVHGVPAILANPGPLTILTTAVPAFIASVGAEALVYALRPIARQSDEYRQAARKAANDKRKAQIAARR